MTLTVGSLCSGIGGIDLGLERAGMTIKWQSEIDPFACKVLKKHWPDTPNFGDITVIDWSNVPQVDVLAGGYPCQPFSVAGKRKGDTDERHLWPHIRNAISVLRPRYVLLENVRGHLTLGGITTIGDLASIGYDAEWRIVRASDLGASHRRERLIIVAYPGSKNMEKPTMDNQKIWVSSQSWGDTTGHGTSAWETHEPALVGMDDGISNWVDRSRALGNAVVPQVAEYLGHLIVMNATSRENQRDERGTV